MLPSRRLADEQQETEMIKKALIAILGLLALLAVWLGVDPQMRGHLAWRAQFVRLKFQGDIPNVRWPEVIRSLGPGDANKAYLLVKNPYPSSADVVKGTELFQAH
jgi:hypothetical protein